MSMTVRNIRDDIMGMPITVEIVGGTIKDLKIVFNYFCAIDNRFSTYKPESELMKINRGELKKHEYSDEMEEVLYLAEKTDDETNGYFSITKPDGTLDPSGIVKGWAIYNASKLIESLGFQNYFIDAGGDIQSNGTDSKNNTWTIGIRNPFDETEIIKVVTPKGKGVATSGIYVRGQHIYNPHFPELNIDNIVSLTVIGSNIYEADRFATAAFAMGESGVTFIENLSGFEGYQIDSKGTATMTSDFKQYVV